MSTNLVVWLIVGLIAGFLASRVLRGRGMGLVMDMVVGLMGAIVGGYLAMSAGIASGGLIGEGAVAFAGALILLLLVRLVPSRGRFSHR